MKTFTNQAALTLHGETTLSNVVTGDIRARDVGAPRVTAALRAAHPDYARGGRAAFLLELYNESDHDMESLTVRVDPGAALACAPDTALLYLNGAPREQPAVLSENPLVFAPFCFPARARAALLLSAAVTRYAPLHAGGEILCRAEISENGAPLCAAETTLSARSAPSVTVIKTLPPVAAPRGRLSYIFLLQNTGSAALTPEMGAVLRDTFNPPLAAPRVFLGGRALACGTDYLYDEPSGAFATLPGALSVPAAGFSQDAKTGAWIIAPAVASLFVEGEVS